MHYNNYFSYYDKIILSLLIIKYRSLNEKIFTFDTCNLYFINMQ